MSVKKTDSDSNSIVPYSPMDLAKVTASIEVTDKILLERAEYYFNQGFVKYDLKDFHGAIADYTKAIEINPDYANAYNNRGDAKKALGIPGGAYFDYQRYNNLKNNNSD